MLAGTLAREAYEWEFSPDCFLPLSACYEALGNYEEALIYRDKGYAFREQMNADKVANLEAEAVIKYETGKKDQQLAE